MDIQDLRNAFESASQQVTVLDAYLHELVQRCARSALHPDTDFSYITFKLKIMSEVKKLYEHYRDIKQEEFQQQCTSELSEILHHLSSTEEQHHHDDDSLVPSYPYTSTPVEDELDIHRVPAMLSPIEDDPMFSDDSTLDIPFSGSTDFASDFVMEQFRDI